VKADWKARVGGGVDLAAGGLIAVESTGGAVEVTGSSGITLRAPKVDALAASKFTLTTPRFLESALMKVGVSVNRDEFASVAIDVAGVHTIGGGELAIGKVLVQMAASNVATVAGVYKLNGGAVMTEAGAKVSRVVVHVNQGSTKVDAHANTLMG
jgi:hypothetical protein